MFIFTRLKQVVSDTILLGQIVETANRETDK